MAKQRPPTNFLSLPCEIRQQILSGVYDLGFENKPIQQLQRRAYQILNAHITYFQITSNAIRNVHPTVRDDFQYVEEKWSQSIRSLEMKIMDAHEYDNRAFVFEKEVWQELREELGPATTVVCLRGELEL